MNAIETAIMHPSRLHCFYGAMPNAHRESLVTLRGKSRFQPGAGKWQLRSTLPVNALWLD